MDDYPFFEETINDLLCERFEKNQQLLKLNQILSDNTLSCNDRVDIALELISQLDLQTEDVEDF